jgi:hypothetical protein
MAVKAVKAVNDITGSNGLISTLVASALAEHRDHSQPSVGNLQGMCVIWWC